jgi:hypothetical protein
MVDDGGAFNKKKFIFGFVRGEDWVNLVNKSPKMSASGSDLATDGPVCPHFGSDCWANLGTCVRIRIGHGRFFGTIYVRTGVEPLTAYSRILEGVVARKIFPIYTKSSGKRSSCSV